MSEKIQRPDIDALQALVDEVTPGSWTYDQFKELVISEVADSVADIGDQHMTDADGFFIAAARNAMPVLLAYVRELERGMAQAAQIAMNLGAEVLHLDGKPDDAPVSIGQYTEPVPGWIPHFSAGIALKASDIREAWAFYERWAHLVVDDATDTETP